MSKSSKKLTKATKVYHKKRSDGVQYLESVRSAFFLYEDEKIKQGKSYVPLHVYTNIVVLFFMFAFRRIMEKSESFYLPHNLGFICLKAYKDNLSEPDKSINWDATIRFKKLMGHINDHSYRWSYGVKWNTDNCKFYNKRFYSFRCRDTEEARRFGVGKLGLRDKIFRASKNPTEHSIFRR